jgi:hypothetical protein
MFSSGLGTALFASQPEAPRGRRIYMFIYIYIWPRLAQRWELSSGDGEFPPGASRAVCDQGGLKRSLEAFWSGSPCVVAMHRSWSDVRRPGKQTGPWWFVARKSWAPLGG